MRRICSWLAQIRAENFHRVVFAIIVGLLLIFFFVKIIVLCITGPLWNLLWVLPYIVFLMSSLLMAADFDDGGDLRAHTYSVDFFNDLLDIQEERDKLKEERNRLYKLRHTRTI